MNKIVVSHCNYFNESHLNCLGKLCLYIAQKKMYSHGMQMFCP